MLVSGAVIYVDTIADLQALSAEVGQTVYLTEEGRAGEGVIKSGTAPSDPLKGVYIPIANGNYWDRSEKRFLTPEMFGAVGDGITDDTLAWQEAERLSAQFVFGKFGATYLCSDTINVTTPVQTDLNGSTVNFSLTTTIPGFYAKADNVAFTNGTINVTGTTMGGNAHSLACITSGVQLTGQGWKGLRVSGITASTNRSDAGAAIAILGACNNFVVENITFPDNPDMAIGVGCEWGGTATGTGHPHNGKITNINAGALTNAAVYPKSNFVVWLSSCFNIEVSGVQADQCYGLLGVHAGDNGNQYAPAAYKALIGTGIKAQNLGCPKVTGEAIRVTGKGSATPTILPMAVEIDGVRAIADGTVATTYAFYGEQFDGPTIKNFYFEGFTNGINALAFSDNLTIEHGKVTLCDNYGAQIGSFGNAARNPTIRHVEFVNNNQSAGGTTANAAIRYLNTRNGVIENCLFGEDGGTETQKYSVALETNSIDTELNNNHTFDVAASGFAYVTGSSTETSKNVRGINNTAESGVALLAGPPIFQIQADGTRHFVDDGIPTNGTFEVGDKVFFTAPAAAGWIGATCVTAGGPGVFAFKRFGQIEA
jgi:hypothetical protein